MNYDGRQLTAPGQQKIVAVWDHTSTPGYTGKSRWLCKADDGQLYLYWCLDEWKQPAGSWVAVKDGCWIGLANYPPAWESDADLAVVHVEKCKCDLHQLMRGDGHDASCPE